MKSVLCLLSVILFFSCENESETQYKFFHVSNLNNDLKNTIGIDINQQKVKADSVFKIDSQFYINLAIEMAGGENSNSFKRSSISLKPVNIESKPFSAINEHDSLASVMMACFADNMIMANCSKKSLDSLCIVKQRWQGFMSGQEEAQFSYGFYRGGLEELYEKYYLSDKEFHYMILYLHYLGFFNGTMR